MVIPQTENANYNYLHGRFTNIIALENRPNQVSSTVSFPPRLTWMIRKNDIIYSPYCERIDTCAIKVFGFVHMLPSDLGFFIFTRDSLEEKASIPGIH